MQILFLIAHVATVMSRNVASYIANYNSITNSYLLLSQDNCSSHIHQHCIGPVTCVLGFFPGKLLTINETLNLLDIV